MTKTSTKAVQGSVISVNDQQNEHSDVGKTQPGLESLFSSWYLRDIHEPVNARLQDPSYVAGTVRVEPHSGLSGAQGTVTGPSGDNYGHELSPNTTIIALAGIGSQFSDQ
ncbi:hypothetical protein NM208_g13322 [Fusarium decemcellulare]|uniref:Uncharacterized protein n=1 Tax=Fusarium decemcellulare TaxID=57161 RepID=A0ACC1RKB8_9HYPO|nr:hypothetical protein NM208_g13322 [Fusarium decemcellulare]